MGVGPKVLTEVFNTIDVDRNGSIDYREFKDAFGEGICGGGYEGMDVFHGEKTHIENIKNRCLRNSPRNMKLETAITELRTRMATQHTKVKTAFRALDRDSSGKLEKGELLLLLKNYHIKLRDADVDKLIARIDTDNSGKVSYREFNNFFGSDIAGSAFGNSTAMNSGLGRIEDKCCFERNEQLYKKNSYQRHQNWTTTDFMNAMESILMTRARTVRRIFRIADVDKSGCIDAKEWHNALSQMNLEMSHEKAKQFFDALDKNGDGLINYREFVAAFGDIVAGFRDTGIISSASPRLKQQVEFGNSMCQPRLESKMPRYTVSQIREVVARRLGGKYTSACSAFRNLDLDKDSSLDKEEFRHFIKSLNIELHDEDYEMLYCELDRDKNGSIDYKEFLFWFGEAICGAPWQANQSTGLCTRGIPHTANRIPEPWLLSWEEALRLLHIKLTETSTSVNKVFKRYNKDRASQLCRKQFKMMFDNYHLHVNDDIVREIVKHIQRTHGKFPADGNGITFPLFVREFGKSIAGGAYVGVVDHNSNSTRNCRDIKPTPKCTAKQARALLIDKLVTNFKHSRAAFTRLNIASCHAMSRGELRNALTCYHIHLDDDAFGEFVQEFDKDNNGVIDFREFLSVVGADVSGASDNGLSVTMQAADDQQKARLRNLHKQLAHQNYHSSDSDTDSSEHQQNSPHEAKNDHEVKLSKDNETCKVARKRCQLDLAKSRQNKCPPLPTIWDLSGLKTSDARQVPVGHAALHRKHWRIPPSRPLQRVISGPLNMTHCRR